MQRLSRSSHAFYSVVLATFMLHQIHANLEEIKLILAKAIKHGSDEALYFNLMLRVLVIERFSENEVFTSFQSLCNGLRLFDCRNAIVHTAGPRFAQNVPSFRTMILVLKYQFSCPFVRVCEGIKRTCNTNSPLPGADKDYPTKNFCLSCRLDLELTWFLEHFRFLDLNFLWYCVFRGRTKFLCIWNERSVATASLLYLAH